ncbi:hypothetical protein CRE_14025 [Caenorhabditis remanei]|uniref:CCHC-type domain-containing protein n=1 Tax=Caenorhabditis remanei TaxID=31234 RepID=E3M8V4_CAERE|nr:hypothetical protein CRE_14025 [Caenorhabditis remanei]
MVNRSVSAHLPTRGHTRTFADVVVGADYPRILSLRPGPQWQSNTTKFVASDGTPIRVDSEANSVPIRKDSEVKSAPIRDVSGRKCTTIREVSGVESATIRGESSILHSAIREELKSMCPPIRDESGVHVISSPGNGDGKLTSVSAASICEGSTTNAEVVNICKRFTVISDKSEHCSHWSTLPCVMSLSFADGPAWSCYSGADEEDLNEFIRSFEDKFALLGKDDKCKGNFLLAHLQGDARDTAQEVLDNNSDATFAQLVEALRARFLHPALSDRYKEMFRSRIMRADETVEDFYRGLTRLAKKIYNTTSSTIAKNEILEQFLYGIDKSMKIHVGLNKPKSPQAALDLARRVEALMPKPKPAEKEALKQAGQSSDYNGRIRNQDQHQQRSRSNDVRRESGDTFYCHYCNEAGHYAYQCPEKARKREARQQADSTQPRIGVAVCKKTNEELQQELKASNEQVEALKQRLNRLSALEYGSYYEDQCMTIKCPDQTNQTAEARLYETIETPSNSFCAKIPIKANDFSCVALVDTGATITVTSGIMCSCLGIPSPEPHQKEALVAFGNNKVEIVGSRMVTFSIGSYKIQHRVHFTAEPCTPRGQYDFILGTDILSRLPAIFDFRQAKLHIGKDVLTFNEEAKCQSGQCQVLDTNTTRTHQEVLESHSEHINVGSWAKEMESIRNQEIGPTKESKFSKVAKCQSTPKRKGTCYFCKKEGHWIRECRKKAKQLAATVKIQRTLRTSNRGEDPTASRSKGSCQKVETTTCNTYLAQEYKRLLKQVEGMQNKKLMVEQQPVKVDEDQEDPTPRSTFVNTDGSTSPTDSSL